MITHPRRSQAIAPAHLGMVDVAHENSAGGCRGTGIREWMEIPRFAIAVLNIWDTHSRITGCSTQSKLNINRAFLVRG